MGINLLMDLVFREKEGKPSYTPLNGNLLGILNRKRGLLLSKLAMINFETYNALKKNVKLKFFKKSK